MPVRELRCNNQSCEYGGITFEWFARRMSSPNPICPKCGDGMEQLVSTFATPFIGLLERFEERGKERFNKFGDGHKVWRTASSRNPDGSPEMCIIRTHQDQREYCKAEGLVMPDELCRNAEISDDGKDLRTTGMNGQFQIGLPDLSICATGNPWLEVNE